MSNTFATRLKQLRINLGYSQVGFSEMLDIPTASYRKYEKDVREPTLSVVSKFFLHPVTKDSALWLLTGEHQNVTHTPPAPVEPPMAYHSDMEQSLITSIANSLEFISHMKWFTPGTQAGYQDYGHIILRDLKPILQQSSVAHNEKRRA
ncbi:helix-turn-helix domain-containing protein [Pseudoalteromonas rubra]|uniref:Helix-turn-helix domain-containing protein n=1 Tax=Pseudoalteromonas rubra TaxID=43658 RepID=A0A5S3UT05_9GAMM|nr:MULTISPECIES: transcriptional regulator [Pseudoalteromonas]MEC4089549.1 helix-turn-helix domain-containing protein [Pseudoalteromonas rubra]QPB82720.1 helix-turn-helix domain-containing protein [Pseudoalteromonas rubra]